MITGQNIYDVVSYVLKHQRDLFDTLRIQVGFYYLAREISTAYELSELDMQFEDFIKTCLATELNRVFKQELTIDDLKAIMYSSKWKESGLDHLFLDPEDYLAEDLTSIP
jgi:hypothetical protein